MPHSDACVRVLKCTRAIVRQHAMVWPCLAVTEVCTGLHGPAEAADMDGRLPIDYLLANPNNNLDRWMIAHPMSDHCALRAH